MNYWNLAPAARIAPLTADVIERADRKDDYGWDLQREAHWQLEDAYWELDREELLANTPEAGTLDEYDPEYHAGLAVNLNRVDTIHPNG